MSKPMVTKIAWVIMSRISTLCKISLRFKLWEFKPTCAKLLSKI